MTQSARHTAIKSGSEFFTEAKSRNTFRSVESHADSSDVLRQLSDVVDSLASLSTPFRHQTRDSNETNGWTLLEHARMLLCVTGVYRGTTERAL